MQAKQLLIAVDQLANTLLGGMADETVSARAYRNRAAWKWRMRFINWLFNDPMHCEDSYLSEVNKSQLPDEYRNPKLVIVEQQDNNDFPVGAILGVCALVVAIAYLVMM